MCSRKASASAPLWLSPPKKSVRQAPRAEAVAPPRCVGPRPRMGGVDHSRPTGSKRCSTPGARLPRGSTPPKSATRRASPHPMHAIAACERAVGCADVMAVPEATSLSARWRVSARCFSLPTASADMRRAAAKEPPYFPLDVSPSADTATAGVSLIGVLTRVGGISCRSSCTRGDAVG
eukprot:scaffold39364_cov63-Phaeocystis_antarctica.AAC.2